MIFFSIPCLVFPSSSRFFRAVTPKRTVYRALFSDASSHLYKNVSLTLFRFSRPQQSVGLHYHQHLTFFFSLGSGLGNHQMSLG